MPFKRHITLFVILFVSCTTSIHEQQDHQQLAYRKALHKTSQPLLAQLRTPKTGILPSTR